MAKAIIPDPIIDKRESGLLQKLTDEFIEYTSPRVLDKASSKIGEWIDVITPQKAKKLTKDAVDTATDWSVIQKALEISGKGIGEMQRLSANYTCSPSLIVSNLQKKNPSLQEFEHICLLRSYDIEKVVQRIKLANYGWSAIEGAGTGALGILGLPLNLALSFLLYFRMAQLVAFYYGYNTREDPREMEFASAVTMTALSPTSMEGGENLTALIGKMMLAAQFTALRDALAKNVTYKKMAESGGAQLLFTQIRALANARVKKALAEGGGKSLEGTLLIQMLKPLGKQMTKEAGEKAIPIVSAFIGAGFDTYYMSQVCKCANMIYHKRFIFEKEERINEIMDGELG